MICRGAKGSSGRKGKQVEKDKISVIIPVYRVERYLDACVASVCAQTYQNLEIILVDDGSPDACGQMCESWAQKDARIKVIHQENKGLSGARNAGMRIATGEYLGFVDSDDTILPEMYEILYGVLTQSGADLAMCAIQCVYADGTEKKESDSPLPSGVMTLEEWMAVRYLNLRVYLAGEVVWNKLYKRNLLENVWFREGVIMEDTPFFNDYMKESLRVAVTDRALYRYLQRKDSIMGRGFTPKSLAHFYALRERTGKCQKLQLPSECVRVSAIQTMNEGVDFWTSLVSDKSVSSKEKSEFFGEVAKTVTEYEKYGSKKQRFYWGFFRRFPKTFRICYRMLSFLRKTVMKVRKKQ